MTHLTNRSGLDPFDHYDTAPAHQTSSSRISGKPHHESYVPYSSFGSALRDEDSCAHSLISPRVGIWPPVIFLNPIPIQSSMLKVSVLQVGPVLSAVSSASEMSSLSYSVPRYVRSHRITAINLSGSGYQQQTVVSNSVVAHSHRNTQAWNAGAVQPWNRGPSRARVDQSMSLHSATPTTALFGHGGHHTLGTIANSAQLRIDDFRRLKDIHPSPYINTSAGPNKGYAGGRDKLRKYTIRPGQLTDSSGWGSLNALS